MNESVNEIRLNKFLSDSGVCSRREADRLIEEKKVTVDGAVAVLGMKINPEQEVICNGEKVKKKENTILIALNKPVGIECTTSKEIKENIVDFVGYSTRIYPVGRLDKNSEGLILMTNDGSLVNHILKASNVHEKNITFGWIKKSRKNF
jgi:23S rRNA pseudouridine2604 synthase